MIHSVLQPVRSHKKWEIQLRCKNCLKQGVFADPLSQIFIWILLMYRFKCEFKWIQGGLTTPLSCSSIPFPSFPYSQMAPVSPALSSSRETAVLVSPAGIHAPGEKHQRNRTCPLLQASVSSSVSVRLLQIHLSSLKPFIQVELTARKTYQANHCEPGLKLP